MNWETFYATCFVIGLLLSVFSFLAGALHLHFPRGMHMHAGGMHAHGHGVGAHGHGAGQQQRGGRDASFFNFGTMTAFLAWFGGTGYLLTRYSGLWVWLAFTLSSLSGLAGSAVVFWFLFKVLLAHEKDLNPADYEMVGVLGRVSSTIREGGIGEMIFSQEGIRRSASARSETGKPIACGVEVVVTQYEGGIAFVRPWDEIVAPDAAESVMSNRNPDPPRHVVRDSESELDSAPQVERQGDI
jgi:membrane protein implicated in regulation of membrane protease activity